MLYSKKKVGSDITADHNGDMDIDSSSTVIEGNQNNSDKFYINLNVSCYDKVHFLLMKYFQSLDIHWTQPAKRCTNFFPY